MPAPARRKRRSFPFARVLLLGFFIGFVLLPLYWMARLLRIAPVNAEMILNYVAQHSLSLPRSY